MKTPEVIYVWLNDASTPEEVFEVFGGWDDNPMGETLDTTYYSAAKAKADKLALLDDIDEMLGGMSELVTKDGVSMFWVKLFDWGNKLDQLKQRIEAE